MRIQLKAKDGIGTWMIEAGFAEAEGMSSGSSWTDELQSKGINADIEMTLETDAGQLPAFTPAFR